MTMRISELTPLVQAGRGSRPEPELACPWRPSGDEPQPCHRYLAWDRSCVGEEVYGVWFTLPRQPRARVTMWLYPAAVELGNAVFAVAWRWRLDHGPLFACGWDHATRWWASAEEATDAALKAAVALACGAWEEFPGGIPGCLHWDGAPW